MKCEGCGAEVMLGSAQCGRCGRSALDLGDGGDGLLPPPPTAQPIASPPPQRTPRPAAPPPPPPTPTPTPMGRPLPTPPSRAGGRSSPAGCGRAAVLSVLLAGLGVFLAVRAGSDAVDDAVDGVFDTPSTAGPGEPFAGPRRPGPPLAIGSPVDVELPEDAVGEHALDALEGRITVSVDGGDGFDPVVQVVGADGDVLGEDDDGGDGLGSRLSVTLPGGAAQVLVREFSGDAGDYRVAVQRGDDVVGIEPRPGPELVLGRPQPGSVLADESVAHSFTAPGGTVVVTVEGRAGFDPVVRVRSAGGLVAENDDTDGRNSRVELALPAGQLVSIEVSGFNGQAGSYEVLVRPPPAG